LKMMIDVFDVNKDGVVDLEEFCRVVEPILS
jgi:Ca2+-binding EF-hand superfamily protein